MLESNVKNKMTQNSPAQSRDLHTKNTKKPRVSICFFGIPRSLNTTRPSIIRNVIEPIAEISEVRIFAHFFNQKNIFNPRTGEYGSVDQDSAIYPGQILKTEEPDLCLEQWGFEKIKQYGDYWENDFSSLRNLIHQLHSIRGVSMLSKPYDADCTVFVRPDLWYYDSLAPIVSKALSNDGNGIYLPYWQPFNGENDRFAIVGKGREDAYANRIEAALEYCKQNNSPLHSEKLLKYVLQKQIVLHIPCRAARVRANGEFAKESFNLAWVDNLHMKIVKLNAPYPLAALLHKMVNCFQKMRDIRDKRAEIQLKQQ